MKIIGFLLVAAIALPGGILCEDYHPAADLPLVDDHGIKEDVLGKLSALKDVLHHLSTTPAQTTVAPATTSAPPTTTAAPSTSPAATSTAPPSTTPAASSSAPPNSTPAPKTTTPAPTSTPPATTASPGICTGTILAAGGALGATSGSNVEIYTVQTGVWAAATPLTTGRKDFQMLTLPDGTVLAAGGVDPNGNFLATSEVYNPQTGNWTVTKGPMMTARTSFQMVLFNGQALAVGGLGSATGGRTAEFYNAISGLWTQTGSMTYSRSSFQMKAEVTTQSVLAAGGGSPVAEIFDGTTWTTTGTLKLGDRRNFQMSALSNGNILISGGYDLAGAAPLITAEIYNYQTGAWAPTGTMSTARGNFRMIGLADGTVLAAGGVSAGPLATPTTFLRSAEIYSPSAGSWGGLSDMGIFRELFAMVPVTGCNNVFVAGGQGDSTGGTVSELYNPGAVTWARSPTRMPVDVIRLEMVTLT